MNEVLWRAYLYTGNFELREKPFPVQLCRPFDPIGMHTSLSLINDRTFEDELPFLHPSHLFREARRPVSTAIVRLFLFKRCSLGFIEETLNIVRRPRDPLVGTGPEPTLVAISQVSECAACPRRRHKQRHEGLPTVHRHHRRTPRSPNPGQRDIEYVDPPD